MRATEIDAEFFDPADDKYTQQQLADNRKPKLTLLHLNRLKKLRAARNLENLVRRDVLGLLYGASAEGAAGGI